MKPKLTTFAPNHMKLFNDDTRGEIHPSIFSGHNFLGGATGATETQNSPGAGLNSIVAPIEEFVIHQYLL